MIITISGLPGAGKSTVAKNLAAELGWPFYSMGNWRRQQAAARGMTLAEYNKLGESDSSTDFTVDRYQEALGQNEDNFIIEGRTAWHFIPQAVKIFLSVEPAVGAQRIWDSLRRGGSQRNEANDLHSVEDVRRSVQKRLASDRRRYQAYLQIDVYDTSHYDLVLDTSRLSREEVLAELKKFIAKQR